MKKHFRTNRVTLVSVCVVAALALAGVAFLRANGPTAADGSAPSTSPYRSAESDGLTMRLDEAAEQISTRVIHDAANLVDAASAEAIAEMSIDRLMFMTDPDLDDWRAMVSSQGGIAKRPEGMDEETFHRRWRGLAARFDNSSVGIEGVSVQSGEAGTEDAMGGPGSRFLRGDSGVSGVYPSPPDGARLIDVLVPIEYRLDGGRRIACTIVFRYADHGASRGWLFRDLFAFFGGDSFGEALNQPLK